MLITNRITAATPVSVALLAISAVAHAGFVSVEDFDGLIPGDIDGQHGWFSAGTTNTVSTDPIGGLNQVVAVTTDSTILFKETNPSIGNDEIRMVFWRFRFDNQLNYSFGLSASTFPTQFGDFRVELGISNSSRELRINDGGQYKVIALLEPDTWYNVWVLVDNPNDQFEIWLNDLPLGDATAADQQSYLGNGGTEVSVFAFRHPGSTEMQTFFVKTGGGNSENSGPLFIDDIFIEDSAALNLTNPVSARDSDGDGVADQFDNCTETRNAAQSDADSDGFGDVCDADYNNDCQVNFGDLAYLKSVFLTFDPVVDHNGDGTVDFADVATFKSLFLEPPGPSALPNVCD